MMTLRILKQPLGCILFYFAVVLKLSFSSALFLLIISLNIKLFILIFGWAFSIYMFYSVFVCLISINKHNKMSIILNTSK